MIMNGKALPPRPGSDGYSNGLQTQFGGPLGEQQNGYKENNSRLAVSPLVQNGRKQSGASPISPSRAVVLDGYRNEIMNGFAVSNPRYNPVCTQICHVLE